MVQKEIVYKRSEHPAWLKIHYPVKHLHRDTDQNSVPESQTDADNLLPDSTGEVPLQGFP